ncbi:hypothetical protein [Acaryochloris sp. IP29b_bin.137]|uniref:hypothetical protein n=1 Tax=Acaryochloris sp. IP29b_bin.137 TaxID=2969217 RepID=UPI002601FC0D|nr:hypothetical protein [Acaryochloris sp. IP29b_bin.137]
MMDDSTLHTYAMNLLLILTGFFIYRAWQVAGVVSQGQPQVKDWRFHLRWISIVMLLCLLNNAMVYSKGALIAWNIQETRSLWSFLRSQFSVITGTSSLMGLVIMSLSEPSILKESTPQRGMYRAMMVIVEKLLPRFWWAVLGLGIVFGFADPGATLFLAVELLLFWLMGQGLMRWGNLSQRTK